MAKYKVYIDTCAYYKEQFNFKKKKNLVMALLLNEINIGNIEILMPTITMNEIKNYILCDVEEYNARIKNAVKGVFQKEPWFFNKMERYDFIVDNTILDSFSDFIKEYKCHIIDCDFISGEMCKNVFENYFNNILPFENKKNKKAEFPDAFVIEILKTFNPKELIVVSNDQGFVNSLSSEVKIFEDIKSLLNYLISKSPNSKNAFYHLHNVLNKKQDIMREMLDSLVEDYNVIIPLVQVLSVHSVKTHGEFSNEKIIEYKNNTLTFSIETCLSTEFEFLNEEQEAEEELYSEISEFIFEVNIDKSNYTINSVKDPNLNCIFIEKYKNY